MNFEENTYLRKLGERLGFFVSFLLFSSIFYLILNLLKKIPDYIRYIHIVTAVVVIYLIGLIFKVLFGK